MRKQFLLVAMLAAGLARAADQAPAKAEGPFDAAETWKKKCSVCHGAEGKGSEKMVKVLKTTMAALDMTTEAVAKKTDAELAAIISEGSKTNKKMTAYNKKYTPADIDALVALIRTYAKASPSTESAPAPAPAPAPAAPAGDGTAK